MCNASGIVFGVKNLTREEVVGKRVIEVGALDINGSLRPIVESLHPTEYTGVDIAQGRGVDVVCSAENLIEEFGMERFDLVISTELIEHVRDWRKCISNIKKVCRPGGVMLITTRSYGFPYHGHPYDFWRYEPDDMKEIFGDCEILAIEEDYLMPGVFLKARKPTHFTEKALTAHELYCIVVDRRTREITDADFRSTHFRRLLLRERLRGLGHVILEFVISKL
jgi:2-polyprenyl-3-methyl-5-hydroxy-6-metoxy-1,4-benzoquinol methylase